MDRLPSEDEALADVRVDEYEARLDALAGEIEPFERQMRAIEGRSKPIDSEES